MLLLDPASGSGNFLTETYISLRRLENEALKEQFGAEIVLGDLDNPIRVSIGQFYGIEINDFAVTVAKTALWIAEAQMMEETEGIVHMNLDFLPLKSYANIVEGNALTLDWESVVPRDKVDYIMGNPPFVGYSLQSKAQKEDMLRVYVDEKGKPYKKAGKIDYVAGWYFKAAEFIASLSEGGGARSATEGVSQTFVATPPTGFAGPRNSPLDCFASKRRAIRAAFVSTNSITQGEQVADVWKPLYERFGIHIDFAHRTFRWDSESSEKAHVHVVIVGFSVEEDGKEKRLYSGEQVQLVQNISPYLVDAPTAFISSRSIPLCEVPAMIAGGKPTDGGNLILTAEEKEALVAAEPTAAQFIRPFMMGKDFIYRSPRYCLWLVGANPADLKKCPKIMEHIEAVRTFRAASPKAATRQKAETPTLFDEVRPSPTDYVAVPKVSSEQRRYIPMDYLSADVIAGDNLFYIPNVSRYHFGVLDSNVHMAWTRTVCGRLKSDYRYSNSVVYNNFPWPTPTDAQKQTIEQTAQSILDARAKYPDASLADLYDETTMPPELRKAHQANDRAVMAAYGFDTKISEAECVARLMEMYQVLTAK